MSFRRNSKIFSSDEISEINPTVSRINSRNEENNDLNGRMKRQLSKRNSFDNDNPINKSSNNLLTDVSSDSNSNNTLKRGKSKTKSFNEDDIAIIASLITRSPSNKGSFSNKELQRSFSKRSIEVDIETKIIQSRKMAMKKHYGKSIESIKRNMYSNFNTSTSAERGPTIITNNIVIGGRDDVTNIELMKSLGITHILNVAHQLPQYHPETEFMYMKVPMLDTDDYVITDKMNDIIKYIRNVENINGRVFVHCISGVSRSVAVLLMYFIMEHKFWLLDAYNYMKFLRPFIAPNDGFKLQLAVAEVNALGFTSVQSNGGKDWDFYKWNNVKSNYLPRKKKGDNSDCCIIV